MGTNHEPLKARRRSRSGATTVVVAQRSVDERPLRILDCELRLGSCIDPATGMGSLETVDHVISDPPYSKTTYARSKASKSHKGSETPSRIGPGLASLAAGAIGAVEELLVPTSKEIARITKGWGLIFSDVEFLHRWRDQLIDDGMRYVRTGAWFKKDPMPQMTGDRPGTGFEPCTIVHAPGRLGWNGGGRPATWHHGTSKGKHRPNHPCPKPLPLMLQIVREYTNPGDLVCDPFAGAATTAIACILLGRRFIGWEIDAGFHATACRRIRSAIADEALAASVQVAS